MKRRAFLLSTGGAAAGMLLLPRIAHAEAGRIDWYTAVGPEHPRLLDQRREADVRGGQSRRDAEPRRRRRQRRQHRHRRARARRAADQRRPAGRLLRVLRPAPARPARIDAGLFVNIKEAGLSNYVEDQPARHRHRLLGALPRQPGAARLRHRPSSTRPDAPKTFADLIAWIKANPGQFIYNRPDKGGSGGNFVRRAIYEANGNDPAEVHRRQLHRRSRRGGADPGLGDPAGPRALAVRRGRLHLGQHPVDPAPRPVRGHHDPGLVRPGAAGDQHRACCPRPPASSSSPTSACPAASRAASILSNGVNKDAALKLADFILTEEIQSAVLTELGGFPGVSWDYVSAGPAREVQGRDPDHHPGLPGRRLGDRDQRRLVPQRRAERGPQPVTLAPANDIAGKPQRQVAHRPPARRRRRCSSSAG